MKFLLLVFLASLAHADPPFYPRGTATNQALGGINQNFLDQTTLNNDRLTTTITPASCASGQVLVGSFFKNGYTFGGTCATPATTDGPNTFTKTITFSSSVVFNGTVAVSSRSIDLQGITFTSTTYGRGVSTLTITISGANPVMVCFSGGVNCGATNGNFGWGFLYDGLYISPQSATVGVTYGHNYAGSGFTTPTDSGCHMVPASSLSAGSHRFIMTALCSAGAITFGQQNGTVTTEDHFFVYELH